MKKLADWWYRQRPIHIVELGANGIDGGSFWAPGRHSAPRMAAAARALYARHGSVQSWDQFYGLHVDVCPVEYQRCRWSGSGESQQLETVRWPRGRVWSVLNFDLWT